MPDEAFCFQCNEEKKIEKRRSKKEVPFMLALYLAQIEEEDEKKKFERVYKEYRNLVCHIAAKVLKDWQLAEDAAQETFFRVAVNIRKIGAVKSAKTRNYIALIARNVALTMAEKEKKQPPIAAWNQEELIEMDEKAKLHIVRLVDAQDEAIVKEIKAQIRELPEIYRQVLYLTGVYECSVSETASLLDLPVETVKKRVQRGRALLKAALEEEALKAKI